MAKPPTELTTGQLQSVTARLRVGQFAQEFREHLAAGDLAGVWEGVDPELRLVWARHWAHARRRHLVRICPNRLATRLASTGGPAQALWRHFENDQLHRLHAVGRSGQQVICPDPPSLPPDVEVLYADLRHPSLWSLPEDPWAVPILMRWRHATWKVLNYGSTALPPTGKPPEGAEPDERTCPAGKHDDC